MRAKTYKKGRLALANELERLFGRPVDFLTERAGPWWSLREANGRFP